MLIMPILADLNFKTVVGLALLYASIVLSQTRRFPYTKSLDYKR